MSAAAEATPIFGRMSEADYEAERKRLRETYGDSKSEAGERFEQELAKLFYRSGWTQEQLAKKEGKSQRRMSELLLFGRFLEFSGTAAKPRNPAFQRLTARLFDSYWRRTDKGETNERIRFQAVLRLLDDATTVHKQPEKFLERIVELGFADGRKHKLEKILEKFEETEHDSVKKALNRGDHKTMKCEKFQSGKSFNYRLFPIRKDRAVSSLEIAEKLGPIIDQLMEQGKKNVATIAPGHVAHLAWQLKELVKEWTK